MWTECLPSSFKKQKDKENCKAESLIFILKLKLMSMRICLIYGCHIDQFQGFLSYMRSRLYLKIQYVYVIIAFLHTLVPMATNFGRNGNFVMRTSWVTFTRSYFVLLIYHVLFFCIKIYTSDFRISNWEVFREKNQVFSFTPLDLLRPQYEKFYKTGKLNLGSFADIINKLYSITLQRQIYK